MQFNCCTIQRDDIEALANPKFTDEETIKIFKAMSHPLRLKILRVLLVDEEVCTCEFTDLFEEVQPAVTKQLSKMRKEGLLASRRISIKKNEAGQYEKYVSGTGKWTYYRLAEANKDLIKHLLTPFVDQGKVEEKILNKNDLVIVVES